MVLFSLSASYADRLNNLVIFSIGMTSRTALLAEINELFTKTALDYSKPEYEKYVKEHPKTKKTVNDPLFQVKGPSDEKTQEPTQDSEPSDLFQKIKGAAQKLSNHYQKQKEATHHHIRNEIKEWKDAGAGIRKHVRNLGKANKETLSHHEQEAVQNATRKAAAALLVGLTGGSSFLSEATMHFLTEQTTEALTADHKATPPPFTKGVQPPPFKKPEPIGGHNITQVKFKNSGDKFKAAFDKKKEAVVHFLKTKGTELKHAGHAIKKFLKGESISHEEAHALKSAAKEIVGAIAMAAFGEHFAAFGLVEAIAVGTIANALVARHPHASKGKHMPNKTAHDEEDTFIQMIVDELVKQLNKLEDLPPNELRELTKKIEYNARHDPKIKREMQEQFGKK